MRWTICAAPLCAAAPVAAGDVAIDSAVYLESAAPDGGLRIAPAGHLRTGDRVVTILHWEAPPSGRYTAVTAVPSHVAIESASQTGLEVSRDGGRSWRRLTDSDVVPAGITHLRWQIAGAGRLTYRAVVR